MNEKKFPESYLNLSLRLTRLRRVGPTWRPAKTRKRGSRDRSSASTRCGEVSGTTGKTCVFSGLVHALRPRRLRGKSTRKGMGLVTNLSNYFFLTHPFAPQQDKYNKRICRTSVKRGLLVFYAHKCNK